MLFKDDSAKILIFILLRNMDEIAHPLANRKP